MKKLFAAMLALIMVLSMMSISALAEDKVEYTASGAKVITYGEQIELKNRPGGDFFYLSGKEAQGKATVVGFKFCQTHFFRLCRHIVHIKGLFLQIYIHIKNRT